LYRTLLDLQNAQPAPLMRTAEKVGRVDTSSLKGLQITGVSLWQYRYGPITEHVAEAVSIREQIESLEERLTALLNGGSSSAPSMDTAPTPARKASRRGRTVSAEARRRMAEAQRARWAKAKGSSAAASSSSAKQATASRKRGISAAGRRKLSEMMKARWAARRKSRQVADRQCRTVRRRRSIGCRSDAANATF
jgi:hypothetical protein